MPSSWTEADVEASLTAEAGVVGRAVCVRVPDDWKGRRVRLLLLPHAQANGAAKPPPVRARDPTA